MDIHLMQYYCREKYYHTMRLVADSCLKKTPHDSLVKFQYCVSLILENMIGEALRELEMLMDQPDVGLAVILSMMYAHKLCEVPDEEAIITLENCLKTEQRKNSEVSLYHAANFCLQVGNYKGAREYADSILRLHSDSTKGMLLKGWLELNEGKFTIAANYFRSVLSQDAHNFDAAIGEVRSSSQDEAMTKLNHLIVKYPKTTIPLIEKMKLLSTDKEWNEAMDVSNRILSMDSNCIPALQFRILYDIRISGNFELLYSNTDELITITKQQEPLNWMINYDFSVVLARLCGYNESAMHRSIKFIEQSALIAPNNIEVNMEFAHHYYLIKNYQKASDLYKRIARLDDTVTDALIGLIKCKLVVGDFNEEIKQQIDFLVDVYEPNSNADLLLLQIADADDRTVERLLISAINLKFKNAENLSFGLKYFVQLDAAFILEALKKFPLCTASRSYQIDVLLKLTQIIPGCTEAWLQLAKIHLEMENYKEAESILQYILNNLDRVDSEVNLILARVLIQQNKYEEAESILDLCLSQNLNIRSKPLFHFLNGKIQKYKHNFVDCITSLENAVRSLSDSEGLKPLDLATLYLDLSSSYQFTRQTKEAADAIHKATTLLEGTSQEDQIIMARVELELWKSDINKALTLLSSVTPDSSLYFEARTKMADIYLKYSKNAFKYIECYKELVQQYPTQENLIKLADAYFSIRKITKAIEIYEKVIEKSTSPKLSKKLAELYCKSHQYGKAMRCYRDAGTEGSLELAQLLFRLNNWDKAEIALSHVPVLDKIILLSKIKEKQGAITTAVDLLNEAYQKSSRTNDTLACQICCQLAEYETKLHNFESAIKNYKVALSHCENNPTETAVIQLSLSKLYLQINDWTSCKTICSSLLNKDPNNELAITLSADLSFRKGDFLVANNLFIKLLSQKSACWLALVRLIEVKRRMGVLQEVKPYLENAANVNPTDVALFYCNGLFHWYNNDLHEAVKCFDYVKYDAEWGQQALYNMVEISLLEQENHNLAQSLLQEMRPNSSEEETNRNLLLNFVLLASKDKQSIEKAMNELTELANGNVLRVGASLGMAMGYMIQKQHHKARNVLKIIAKTAWQVEEAEYLERCWLMLAEHYVSSSKSELAYDLIKKILNYNAGCAKAYELQAAIAEKDQKYGDAATHYLRAWNLNGQKDPVLAYKLGSYFLKCKKYADAISICQTIMRKIPDHAKVKRDIFEKSLSLLRT